MSKTRICLVRHGETAWNVEKRLQGHLDIPLNENGLKQAAASARGLAGISFAAIYSSDLQRARSTAQAAAKHIGLPVRATRDLRERHYGVLQGLTPQESRVRHPEAFARYQERDPDFLISGGESLSSVATRIAATFDRLASAHPGETLLIVSHGGVLDIMHRRAVGKPLDTPRDFSISNASLNWLEYEAGCWRILSWDDKAHLEETLDELPG